MKWTWYVLIALFFITVVALAGKHMNDREQLIADQTRRIAQLEQELAGAQLQLVMQRAMLRDKALKASPSPDEFLGLFPSRFPDGDWRPAETQFEDVWFAAADGVRLHGWYLAHPQPKAVILHLHGNAGNISHRAQVANLLRERFSVSVLLLDYRGYGRSEGVPTMSGLLLDARAARKVLAGRAKLAENEIVLLGESLGGAIAVDLAAKDDARGLILENTFSSFRDVAGVHYPKLLVNLLVADRLNSAAQIGKYQGPLLQVHGDADEVVPLESAKKLFAAANEPKTFVQLRGHNHNDVLSDEYYHAFARFLRSP